MYIEDFLIAIGDKCALRHRHESPVFGGLFDSEWYRSFISSVTQHVRGERALSSNQSQMILKMIEKARYYLAEYEIASRVEIDAALAAPQHRHVPYVSSQVPREARYVGDNLLALRCKADSVVTTHIKALGIPTRSGMKFLVDSRPRFDWTHKLWIIPVYRFNLRAIMALLHEHRFRCDRLTSNYLEHCTANFDQPSRFTFADESHLTLIVHVDDDYLLGGWITNVAGGIVL